MQVVFAGALCGQILCACRYWSGRKVDQEALPCSLGVSNSRPIFVIAQWSRWSWRAGCSRLASYIRRQARKDNAEVVSLLLDIRFAMVLWQFLEAYIGRARRGCLWPLTVAQQGIPSGP